MEREIRLGLLLDCYKRLLTPRQAEAMDLYYNGDLSLFEIGENLGISRQGVHDLIRRAGAQLERFESMLGIGEHVLRLARLSEDVCSIGGERAEKCAREIRRLIADIGEGKNGI